MQNVSYANRANLEYIDQLYQTYQQDPESVEIEWRRFFEGMEFGMNSPSSSGELSSKELSVYQLIRAYREYGHLKADLDPLDLADRSAAVLELSNFDLSDKDLNTKFQVGQLLGPNIETLQDILSFLDKTYCRKITVQVAECPPDVRDWFEKEMEAGSPAFNPSAEDKKRFFEQVARTESLEKFLHTRFVGMKRFSVEGADSIIPMLEHLAYKGTSLSVEELVIGMAHRGRINVLANFMDKGLENVLSEFEGNMAFDDTYEGDVKYHLGFSTDKETPNGPCHVSLAFNPSHLECVSPVALGMVRAKQRVRKDTAERKKVIPVLIHGDAAFAGQGVVTETLQLSQLDGYKVGGAVHVILNNQVGFTTNPSDSRSTRYSSDIAKSIKAPVILVNGDHVESSIRAMDIALRFRQKFKQDVVIDLICYRRFGHNEGDEPMFTQPKMYKKIKKHPTHMEQYQDYLDKSGIQPLDVSKKFYQEKIDNLQVLLDSVRKDPPKNETPTLQGLWKGFKRGFKEDLEKTVNTQPKKADFDLAAQVLTELPGDFNLNSKVKKLILGRAQMLKDDKIDWGLGELLAYGTLRAEGTPVRLSGQDCKRGTFSHRHSVYFDGETAAEYSPLKQMNKDKGEFCVYNSNLSEMAVLGFEYGNSSSDPTFLTIWEAQFGDFANGAQIIIDQFITSAEAKWARMSGLVLLLPHGYEGQGPEHSSARLERFLQSCAQENIQVCNITSPANFFHALRRQIKRDFRKPLVVMSPKSLLRHPKVVSAKADFLKGEFLEVIEDPKATKADKVETLFLCSGKVYFDIDAVRDDKPSDKISLTRVEQLYPFPKHRLNPIFQQYKKLKRVFWVQEEPKNMGSWNYIQPELRALMDDIGLSKVELGYIGREAKASPATGISRNHVREQEAIINQVMDYA